jgi:hypothetical protein
MSLQSWKGAAHVSMFCSSSFSTQDQFSILIFHTAHDWLHVFQPQSDDVDRGCDCQCALAKARWQRGGFIQ